MCARVPPTDSIVLQGDFIASLWIYGNTLKWSDWEEQNVIPSKVMKSQPFWSQFLFPRLLWQKYSHNSNAEMLKTWEKDAVAWNAKFWLDVWSIAFGLYAVFQEKCVVMVCSGKKTQCKSFQVSGRTIWILPRRPLYTLARLFVVFVVPVWQAKVTALLFTHDNVLLDELLTRCPVVVFH